MNVIDRNVNYRININTLLCRKKGQQFCVVNGIFTELNGLKRLYYFTNKKFRESVQKDVSNEISNILNTINTTLENETDAKKQEYRTFIFDKLSRLNTKLFNRDVFNRPEYQNLVQILDENYQPSGVENDINFTQDENYLTKVENVAKFALKLGIKPEPVTDGVSGTYFLKNLSEAKIAVYKPNNEEVLAENSPKLGGRIKRLFLKIFPIYRTAVFCCQGNGYKSETAASKISRSIGLNNVPLTKIVSLSHPQFHYTSKERKLEILPLKTGSFQVFINEEGLSSTEETLKISPFWCLFPQLAQWRFNSKKEIQRLNDLLPQNEFEKLAILDIVIGNLDRHFRNSLMANKKVYCIDNGYALPAKHSDSSISKRNQYAWRVLPHANRPFSKSSIEMIEKIKDEFSTLIQQLKNDFLINEDQAKKMSERVAMMNANRRLPIRKIAKYRSTQDFEKLRSKREFQMTLETIQRIT